MAPKQDKTGLPQQTPAGQVPQPFAAPAPGATHSHPIHLSGGEPSTLNAAGLLADPTIPPGGEPAQAKQVPPPAPKPPLPASRSGIPPGGELRVASHQLEEEQEGLDHELGEIEEEEQEDMLGQEEEGSESQHQQGSKHRNNSQEDQEGLKGQPKVGTSSQNNHNSRKPTIQTPLEKEIEEALQDVKLAVEEAETWADSHTAAIAQVHDCKEAIKMLEGTLETCRLTLEAAKQNNEHPDKVMAIEKQQVNTEMQMTVAMMQLQLAESKEEMASIKVLKTAHHMEAAKQHVDNLLANQAAMVQFAQHSAQTKDNPGKTKAPTQPPKPTNPLGQQGPSIYVPLIPLPRPGRPLSISPPYPNVTDTIFNKYCALEQYVASHEAHAYVANDVMPSLATVLNWLKPLKKMLEATQKTRRECTLPQDAQTVGVMLAWLTQLRKAIGNIGRVQAAKEGIMPPMDNIHTDDELPEPSHRSHSKTGSKTSRQEATSQPKSTTLLNMTHSNMTNETQNGGKSKIVLSKYSAAPPGTPIFAQYIPSSASTCMEAYILNLEKRNKNIFSFIEKSISADTEMFNTANKVYKDKQDMTDTHPITREVNEAIQLVQAYPVGSYPPEEAFKVHKVACLFTDVAMIPRLTTLVLAKIVNRDFGKTNERVKRVKEGHIKTLSTLLILVNQHVAFRKDRYTTVDITYPGVTFPPTHNQPTPSLNDKQIITGQHIQPPPPPPPKPNQGPKTDRNYYVQTPGGDTPAGFRRGGTLEPSDKLITIPPKAGPKHGYNTPKPNTNKIDYEQLNQEAQTPKYGKVSHNVRHSVPATQTGHEEVIDFPADKRGKFEFYGNATERWPAYAHHFQYQPTTAIILNDFTRLEGTDKPFRTRSLNWTDSEKLRIDRDFPQWEKRIFHDKLAAEPNIMNHSYTYATALWSGLSTSVKEAIELNVDKTAGDHALPAAMFMAELWKRTGALEWLLFNLSKLCRCHQDDRKQRSLKILTNATVTPTGDNAARVLNEIMTAGDIACGEGGDKYPYMMAVQQLVRSLQYCTVNNANTDIKIRQVEVPYTDSKGELHRRWVPFDITNEWDEQTDRLPTGEIDWKNRWEDVKHKARSIVSSLSTSVKQDPTAHRYYPVFIRDWAPIEPIGMVKGAGPQPPASYPDTSYRRGRHDHKRPRSGYDSSRSRSADSGLMLLDMKLTGHNCQSTVGTRRRKERGESFTNKEDINIGSKMSTTKEGTVGTKPTNQGPTSRNMAPHPSENNKSGINKGTLACFVVRQDTTPNLWTAPQETSTIGTGPQIGMP
jgi:hypothetical protein